MSMVWVLLPFMHTSMTADFSSSTVAGENDGALRPRSPTVVARVGPPRTSTARRVTYVVDDSEDARELFGDALRDAGYRVVEACDGKEAVDLLLDHPSPTAIVLDLLMPGVDGYQVLDLISSYTRLVRVPTLVVTAVCEEVELRLPYARCLRKPVDPLTLVTEVEALVAEKERHEH
jgi:CheY-like chemotaxis protein